MSLGTHSPFQDRARRRRGGAAAENAVTQLGAVAVQHVSGRENQHRYLPSDHDHENTLDCSSRKFRAFRIE
eukprot:6196049-Pleurochrysis_carterae.AAC.2